MFFALWTLPALAVYAVVHLGQPGYLLTVLPACYLVVGRTLVALWQRLQEVRVPAAWRGALAGLALAGALGAHVAFFTAAGPVDAPSPAADASWRARATSELRALYRFRLWSHTAAGLREQEAVIGDYVAAVRRQFDPRDTVLVTELGNPRSYPWFRHVMYYLPEYTTYHLRLGEAAPGLSGFAGAQQHGGRGGAARAAPRGDSPARLGRRRVASRASAAGRARGSPAAARPRRSTCCGSVGARSTMPATSWSP